MPTTAEKGSRGAHLGTIAASTAPKRNSWTSVREAFEMAMENGDVEPLMRAQVRGTEVLGKSPYPKVESE